MGKGAGGGVVVGGTTEVTLQLTGEKNLFIPFPFPIKTGFSRHQSFPHD